MSKSLDDPAAQVLSDVQGPKFKMISKALSVSEDPDGRRRFHLTASSTIEDRVGDEIEVDALQKAALKFRDGVTIFMDHDWKHVESAFGVTDSAEVIQKGVDPESGKPIYDLDISGPVNVPNPRAKQLADSIDGGYVKLGASLTAFVRKHMKKPDGRGMIIKEIDPVEASVVGIAENQRSWAHKAALAVKSFYKEGIDFSIDDDEEEAMSDDETIEKGMDAPETLPNPDAAGPDESPNDDQEKTDGDAATPAGTEAPAPEPESTESVNPDGQESASAGETPETASDGDSAGESADTPVTEKAFEPADVAELLGHTTNLVTEIGRLNEVIVQKDATIDELTAKVSRYEADTKAVTDQVDTAAKVIEKVLEMPLRPRAQAIVERSVSDSLFQNHPVIADYLNKRRHLTNG